METHETSQLGSVLPEVLSPRSPKGFRQCIDWWRDPAFRSLKHLIIVMASLYVGSLVALLSIGLGPAVPWQFVLVVPLFLAPFAITFLYYSRQRLSRVVDIATSGVVLLVFDYLLLWAHHRLRNTALYEGCKVPLGVEVNRWWSCHDDSWVRVVMEFQLSLGSIRARSA